MRFLILGSASLLGAGLCEELAARGHAITILTADPRRVPESWKLRFRCYYGQISNAHILHAALEDADRILFAPSHPRHISLSQTEPTHTQMILEANSRSGGCPVLKLTSWGAVYESQWWAMAARREADQLARLDPHGHLFAVGWLGEALQEFLHKGIFWIPSGFEGKVLWISRSQAIRRLCDLFLLPVPPRLQEVVGSTRMTLPQAVSHVVARSISGATGTLRFPGAQKLVRFSRWLPESFQSLERVAWGCAMDDPDPGELPWIGEEDPFAQVLNKLEDET